MSKAEDEARFADPQLAINRVYTKKGDTGQTSLVGGQKVPKDEPRIEAYGTVDELMAFVGVARCSALDAAKASPNETAGARLNELADILRRVQHELFNLGSLLATLPSDLHPKQARVTDTDVTQLEHEIDHANEDLPPLRSFVLPGGSRLNAELHVARTVCRRAERLLVAVSRLEGEDAAIDPVAIRYLNRLSDALFVWSRHAALLQGVEETLWTPNASATGTSTSG